MVKFVVYTPLPLIHYIHYKSSGGGGGGGRLLRIHTKICRIRPRTTFVPRARMLPIPYSMHMRTATSQTVACGVDVYVVANYPFPRLSR